MTKNMSAKIVDFLIDIGFEETYPRKDPREFYTDRNLDEIHIEVSERTINLSRDKKEMIRSIIIDAYNSGIKEGKEANKDEFANFVGLNEIRESIQELKYRIDDLKHDD